MTQTNNFTDTETIRDSSATTPEIIKVRGESLVAKVKELIHLGNVTRIVLENRDGDPVFEVPVNGRRPRTRHRPRPHRGRRDRAARQ